MIPRNFLTIKRLFVCGCANYHRVPSDRLRPLLAGGQTAGWAIELIADLCHSAIHDPTLLARMTGEETIVAACHARAVRGLFAIADLSPPDLIDLCGDSPEVPFPAPGPDEPISGIDSPAPPPPFPFPPYVHAWKAWFPVIDRDRCTGCGKCIDFCLFGVYARSDDRVVVTNPSHCKTNCPACARVCPHQAIMFPKHSEPPINGGPAILEPGFSETSSVPQRTGSRTAADGLAEHFPNPGEPIRAPSPDELNGGESLYATLARRRKNSTKPKLLKE
jgi:NAD-dependent dihydropyrimidine dehydrogenase PreA subunit